VAQILHEDLEVLVELMHGEAREGEGTLGISFVGQLEREEGGESDSRGEIGLNEEVKEVSAGLSTA
jgi:hypothetical protein